MSLVCGCDSEEYVDIDPERMSMANNTIICRECGHLIKPDEDYYRIRVWEFDEYGEETDTEVREVCEGCGDLAYTILQLGYCYTYGSLRSDVREMAAVEDENRRDHAAWMKRKREQSQ